jgi:Raf kinase inhibitor-like YbhB/YbcL family protein
MSVRAAVALLMLCAAVPLFCAETAIEEKKEKPRDLPELQAGTPTLVRIAKGEKAMGFTLKSSAFEHEGEIPSKYTCDAEDVSPPLSWESPPEGVKSFALISDDPDAPVGTWVHWVVWKIPADARSLPEGVPTDETLESGARQGKTDFGRIGYGGPCPPSGTHRYFFKLYALDSEIAPPARATKKELLEAMKGHVLEEAVLMGKYKRKR